MNSSSFVKMLLHAAKYPHCSVNGIFLRRQTKEPNPDVTVKDCIPLFHLNLTLLPMLEVALSQIEAYCKEEKMAICGYYHIHSNIADSTPDSFIIKLMERLTENCGKVYLCMVDNCKLNSKDRECPYKVYEYQDGRTLLSSGLPLEQGAIEASAQSIKNGEYANLVDFDNHLDDISLDWRNRDLVDV